jgi:hypothetical protein
VDPTVAADPDEVVVERGVVDLREGDAVGDDRLTEQLVRVGHDVGRVQHLARPASRLGDQPVVMVLTYYARTEICTGGARARLA